MINVASKDAVAERLEQALNGDRPTMVMFYESDDPRCIEEKPIVDEVAGRMSDKADFFCINASTELDLKAKYHLHAYPTFIVFRDGQEAWRATGRTSAGELEDMVKRFI